MRKLEFLLMQIEGYYYLNNPMMLEFLNDSNDVNVNLIEESLKELYSWKNGSKVDRIKSIGHLQFCSFGYLLPYESALFFKAQFDEDGYFRSLNFFPFIASLGGDYLLIDQSKKKSKVFLYSPSMLVNKPTPIYSSIDKFIEVVLECLEQRVYTYDNELFLTVNYELENTVSRRIDPKIKFWEN